MAEKKTYTNEFKKQAIAYKRKLEKDKSITIGNMTITTIRELIKALDCSSKSLYAWEREIIAKEEILEKHGKKSDPLEVKDDFFKGKETPNKKEIEMNLQEKIFKIMTDYRHTMAHARELGIKGYGDYPQAQLQLLVGLKWIEASGLLDMERVRKVFNFNNGVDN